MRILIAAVIALLAQPALAGSDPFIGEVETYAFNFCPRSFAPLNGQLLPIAQNTALFSLLGTNYGGDGKSTFALPAAKPIASANGSPLKQCIALEGVFPSRD